MFNKFELFGIGASIMSMAVALYLINIKTSNLMSSVEQTALTQSAIVIVGDSVNQESEIKTALLNGMNENGTIEKLIVDDVVLGNGVGAAAGNTITVHYIGTLPNGQEFDNSNKRGEPFTFTLGEGKVIKGWEEGIIGMKVGGQRILVVPADQAYGASGYGPIPGNATLVFSVELLKIE